MDTVVPFPMEFIPTDPELGHFLIRDFDPLLVGIGIQRGMNRQTLFRPGIGNEVDNRIQTNKGPPAPVLGNVAEHAVLDLVPLAGSRGQVADGNG